MSDFTPLTPEQYSAARVKFSPDQILQFEQRRKSEASAGQPPVPTSDTAGAPTDSSFLGTMGRVDGAIGVGIDKGVASTVAGLSKMGNKIADNTVGRVGNFFAGNGFTPTKAPNALDTPTVDKALTPTGAAQNVGFYGEKAAEFLTPAGLEREAISAGDEAIEGLNLIKKFGPLVGKTVSTALKGTVRALTGGASGTIIGTAQTGSLKKGEDLGIANAIASPLIDGAIAVMPRAAEVLQQVSMRLTPSDKKNFATRLSDITQYMMKNNVVGTAKQQSEKMDAMFSKTEDTLQKTFEANPDKFVSKQQLRLALDKAKEIAAKDSPDAQSAIKQIDDAKANLDFQYGGDKIPLARINELKRNTMASAFNRAGTKILGDVEFAIGDVYKTAIEDASKGMKIGGKDIADFNKDYGSLINARKFMAAAETKSPKLVERVLSAIIGGAAGSAVPGIGTTAGIVGGLVGGPLIEKPAIDIGTSVAANLTSKMAQSARSAILRQTPKVALPYLSR